MGITTYQKQIGSETKTLYLVTAEAINRYTGKRVQMKRRGIPSKPKAQHVYKELWSMCRELRPDGVNFTKWFELYEQYVEYLYRKVRSQENPHGFSPKVVASKRSRLKHLEAWSDMHLDLVTPHFVSEQLDLFERQGMSRSSTNHLLKEIKCMFTFGLQMGAIKFSPFSGVKMRKMPKKRKEALTHEEANKLLQEAKMRNHPYYNVWLLSLSLGLRRSELAGLKWLDVDLDQRLVYLRRQMIPGEGIVDFLKDIEERVVAIPQQIIPALKELKLQSKSDFVIELKCHHWNSGQQSHVIREFCREIGIKEVTHHQLRATHITLALVDGVPLGVVKENVGHAKLSTTDEYFRSAGINMKGQTDGLRIQVPQSEAGQVISIKSRV